MALEAALLDRRRAAYLLDGDNLRHGLNGNLGFSAGDRAENVRRTGEVARLFADAGVVALVSLVSPYEADRARVRELHAGPERFRSSRCSWTRRWRNASGATRKGSLRAPERAS